VQKDHYGILQVRPEASSEVIEAAYKALMKLHHPDRNATATMARYLNEAREVLVDPARRAEYDKLLRTNRPNGRFGIGRIVGNYKIVRQIAEGGIGETYYAEHVINGKPACLKHCSKLRPAYQDVMLREVDAAWDLSHFSIPQIRDLLKMDDGTLVIVSKFIEGLTVAQMVEKVGRIYPEDVTSIAERVLNVLWYLHDNRIVHGDIKPQNIIVKPKSRSVFVIDFGLAMVKPTATDTSMGYTDLFAPPEQVGMDKPLLPASDFYSMGMTMLWALCGGIEDDVKSLRVPADTPDQLCDFMKRLLVRDVLARPQNAEPLYEEIGKIREIAFGRRRTGGSPMRGF